MVAVAPVRGGSIPVWQQVESDIERRLTIDDLASPFPSELELAAEYGVSRQTVRQALRRLRAEGRLRASRGRVSTVAGSGEMTAPLGALYGLLAAAEAAGLKVTSTVRILAVRADAHIARRLDLDDATPLVLLDRVRYAGKEPLALDRLWMPAALAAPLLDVDFTAAKWYVELARRAGVRLEGGEEQIYAVVPAEPQRKLLAMPPDAGAFAIRQVSRVAGVPAVCRQVLVRGDRFGLRAEFDAVHGYRLAAARRAGWETR